MAYAPELFTTFLLAEAAQGPLPPWMGQMLLPLSLFGVFYFLVIRPGIKKEQTERAIVNSLTPGQVVELKSGIIGKFVSKKDDGTFEVELADRFKVSVLQEGIRGPFAPKAAQAAKPDKIIPASK